MDPDEFSKSGRIVIPDSLGIAPGFKDRVGLDNLVLQSGLSFLPLACGSDGGKIRNNLLCIFSLPSSRFSTRNKGFKKVILNSTYVIRMD